MDPIASLSHRVQSLELQLEAAKHELEHARSLHTHPSRPSPPPTPSSWPYPLHAQQYTRYSRQLILPEVHGTAGQLCLLRSSVLIVGAGGLGCPAALYLSGAGIGRIGIIDGDVVEESNLQRQIAHSSPRIGANKARSLTQACRALNPTIEYETYPRHLDVQGALELFPLYDVILDCTDTPMLRFLISDCAVACEKSVVSAGAVGVWGQVAVLNWPPRRGARTEDGQDGRQGVNGGWETHGSPCYRCVFPAPPPPASRQSCGENGILGPVVGVVGVLQALETVKVLLAHLNASSSPSATSAKEEGGYKTTAADANKNTNTMLLFSAYNTTAPFRTIRLRPPRKDCKACGEQPDITRETLQNGEMDYARFCGVSSPSDVLEPGERITPREYVDRYSEGLEKPVLIDTREAPQFGLFHLPSSVNIPFSDIQGWRDRGDVTKALVTVGGFDGDDDDRPIHFICARGNDSQVAVRRLKQLGFQDHVFGGKEGDRGQREGGEESRRGDLRYIGDVGGGWEAWRREFPGSYPDA